MIDADGIRLIESAAEELEVLIDKVNADLKSKIQPFDLDEPDYLSYQTCYELMVLAKDLNELSNIN